MGADRITTRTSPPKSLMRQALQNYPSYAAGRICFMVWWIGSMVFSTTYCGNLVAHLTVSFFPATIKTVEDLAKSELKMCMVDYGEFVADQLKSSEEGTLRSLGNRLYLAPWESHNGTLYYDQLLKNCVSSGKGALIETYSYLLKVITKNNRGNPLYYMMKEQIYSGPLAFYYTKHTSWHHRFDEPLNRLFESGLINKWYNDFMNQGNALQTKSTESSLNPLTLRHLEGPLLIALFGSILAITVFILELTLFKRNAM